MQEGKKYDSIMVVFFPFFCQFCGIESLIFQKKLAELVEFTLGKQKKIQKFPIFLVDKMKRIVEKKIH